MQQREFSLSLVSLQCGFRIWCCCPVPNDHGRKRGSPEGGCCSSDRYSLDRRFPTRIRICCDTNDVVHQQPTPYLVPFTVRTTTLQTIDRSIYANSIYLYTIYIYIDIYTLGNITTTPSLYPLYFYLQFVPGP